jgi:alkaline phosphatase D|tara:strand:+ start:171 stop:305 length:135 start_codon:yes stop_codon:yes gene_type:complete
MDNHFGLLTIKWDSEKPKIKMENWDIYNNQRFELTINQNELNFK